MVYIVYKLYMYLRRHCSNTLCPKIESGMLGRILLPPELSNQGNTTTISVLAMRVQP